MATVPLEQRRTEIAELLEQMCTAAAAALRTATVALRDERPRLAERVVTGDAAIDDLRAEVERQALTAMALNAPVAGDLRTLVAAIRCAGDIERMGDLATHVARAARRRPVPDAARSIFERMGELAAEMADQAAEVARTRNVLLALELDRMDDTVDRCLREVFELTLDPAWEHGVGAAVDVTLLARYYERFADHAVAVAKQVVYMVTGQQVEQVAAELSDPP
ncbi:phosphate signaling complex protein PhoU [Pseudonocardia sp. CA-107938]|uniref:phosphate signaling complex protein PhoU n=1 Tax=Pseudonocardia sp. CA-107938 TaxID=3240021 RepID=UPI003D9046D4